jgi:hypothetical protein
LALNTIALKDARLVMVYKIANEQVAIAKKIDSSYTFEIIMTTLFLFVHYPLFRLHKDEPDWKLISGE